MKTRLECDSAVQCIPLLMLLSLLLWPGCAVSRIPPGWEPVIFAGKTRYHHNGECWQAQAQGTASGWVNRAEVNLTRQPVLNWSWRAEARPAWPVIDERSPKGDDYLARVYVVKEGLFPWQSKAINYVWSRQYQAGDHWPNPHAAQVTMVVVQGDRGYGAWQHFRRDVQADFLRFYGVDVKTVHAVAIMTDGDNTGTLVEACYQLPEFRAAVQ